MLTLPGIFSSHMVLQREKPIPVWGTAHPGAPVIVTLDRDVCTAAADSTGAWSVRLPPRPAGGPCTLTVTAGEETIAFDDVLLGDVWLAGGQSNMELELKDAKDAKNEVAASDHPLIRFYNVPKCPVLDDSLLEQEANAAWQVSSPETAGHMSAVAYFFAREISAAQSVPVGVIDCYWGGTSVSCWMSEWQLRRTRAGQHYLDRWAALVGDKTDEDYAREMAEYDRQWRAWNDRVEARRAKDPDVTWEVLNEECGLCPWPQPAGSGSAYRPAGLYETMLRRVVPYGLKGFLWYQGEEDWERYHAYTEMMAYLIDQWRTDWGDHTLPFFLCQLPMYCSKEEYVNHWDSKCWPLLRDAQLGVCRLLRHTGMAVLTDCGEFDNIHPTDKQTVGHRLALQARRKVYGEEVQADAPILDRVTPRGGTVTVSFRHTGGSLFIRGDVLEGFEIAGADGAFFPASGKVEGETVVLSSPNVPQPLFVRYAWTNYGPANLYGASGLPAASFRSDLFPIFESEEALSWRS